MSIWATIGAVLQLALLWFKKRAVKDEQKRKRLQEGEDDIKKALKTRDPSALTSGYDKLNSV